MHFKLKESIKKKLPKPIKQIIYKIFAQPRPFDKNYKRSYAQCGDDLILDIIIRKHKGFYVDIGANNPFEQSNTMYFYKKGWHGINIDATPGSMTLFNRFRKRDTNIEAAIANEEKEMIYYLFEPTFYNTFDKRFAEEYKDKLIGQTSIKTTKLSNILDQYVNSTIIDFITVDAEGYDYDILKSNDWQKFRPKVVVIEFITYYENEQDRNTKMKEFLESVGYKFFCNSPTNAFFVDNKFFNERFSKR